MTVPHPQMRAWAEVHESALRHNIELLRARLQTQTRLLAVVKADAYGHGVGLVAPLCGEAGIADFGVATVEEGMALRALLPAEVAVYLLAPSLPAAAPAIVAHTLTPLVGDLALAQALSDAAQAQNTVCRLHLDIDTGIGRAGALPTTAAALQDALRLLPCLQITGIATQFAEADEDPQDAFVQNDLFQQTVRGLLPGTPPLLLHAGNSPALLALGDAAHYGLVRPGLLLYGIEPAPGLFAEEADNFQPVLSLRARVLLCRRLPGGATISYGRTYTVPPGGGTYATLGIGYGDGFPRRLSNGTGQALLHGQPAPIVGRVCMDQLVVDVSHIRGVQAGDVATLIGTDGAHSLRIGQIAEAIRTTPHEISTCLTARIPRLRAA